MTDEIKKLIESVTPYREMDIVMYSMQKEKWILKSDFDRVVSELTKHEKGNFVLPSDQDMIEIAILFNNGILDKDKLSDMVAYGQFIVDRLFENGDVKIKSTKEK